MRRTALVPIVALFTLAFAGPALAARPTIVSFADDDAADSAVFTEACGFPVTSESSGHVIFHNSKNGAATEIANYNINNWLSSENGSYHLVDAGPDMQHRRAGTIYSTVTGRSLTFSTVIGRVEINTETGEVTYHGNLVGQEPLDPEWYAPICEALS
jgi:hypothetical protein